MFDGSPGFVSERKAAHQAFATEASNFRTFMRGFGAGCTTEGMIFIKGVVSLWGLHDFVVSARLEFVLCSTIIFAHFFVRSSHSVLVQMTPP